MTFSCLTTWPMSWRVARITPSANSDSWTRVLGALALGAATGPWTQVTERGLRRPSPALMPKAERAPRGPFAYRGRCTRGENGEVRTSETRWKSCSEGNLEREPGAGSGG